MMADIIKILNQILCYMYSSLSDHIFQVSNFNFQPTVPNTVGINPVLSDLNTPRTSKLGWRYFEANKIDRNELQIPKNSQKGTGTEKLNNFEKFERKKETS